MPDRMPITEDTLQRPVNPYGETKLIVEKALYWYGQAHGLRSSPCAISTPPAPTRMGKSARTISRDPSHPAGAGYRAGRPRPDRYLRHRLRHAGRQLPARLHSCHRPRRGPCQGAGYLFDGGESTALNLGTGSGHSVREVIASVERVTGRPVAFREMPRRPGDPAVLVADPARPRRCWAGGRNAPISTASSVPPGPGIPSDRTGRRRVTDRSLPPLDRGFDRKARFGLLLLRRWRRHPARLRPRPPALDFR